MYSKYTYASINEFLNVCKELADKYGSEMIDEQSLSILTKDRTKIILPAKTIVDTACAIDNCGHCMCHRSCSTICA